MWPAWIIHSLMISYHLLYLYKEYYNLEDKCQSDFTFWKVDDVKCRNNVYGKFAFRFIVITYIHNEWNELWLSLCLYCHECYHSLSPLFKEGVEFYERKVKRGLKKGGGLKSEGCRFLKKREARNSLDPIILIVSIICCFTTSWKGIISSKTIGL